MAVFFFVPPHSQVDLNLALNLYHENWKMLVKDFLFSFSFPSSLSFPLSFSPSFSCDSSLPESQLLTTYRSFVDLAYRNLSRNDIKHIYKPTGVLRLCAGMNGCACYISSSAYPRHREVSELKGQKANLIKMDSKEKVKLYRKLCSNHFEDNI